MALGHGLAPNMSQDIAYFHNVKIADTNASVQGKALVSHTYTGIHMKEIYGIKKILKVNLCI